jgi:hypothetical protein
MNCLSHLVKVSLIGIVALLVGCGSTNEHEEPPAVAQEGELVGVLTSPQNLKDENMVGTWVPVDPGDFIGTVPPKAITFDKVGETRIYSSGTCVQGCEPRGTWFITDNPVVSILRGKYIRFQPDGEEAHQYFVSRRLTGEIRLVDHGSLQGVRYHNQWTRTPALTVQQLQ